METSKEETPKAVEDSSETLKSYVERIEQAKKELEELTRQNKELFAQKILGGNLDAGTKGEEEIKEETPQEYAKRVMSNKL